MDSDRFFCREDAGCGCGDSLLIECWGLGGTLLAAAPALWPVVGVSEERARGILDDARLIALGLHPVACGR